MGEATFGKYRLIAELGHGGMADVFLAVIAGPIGSGFTKLTVVKRLRQNLAEEPEFVEMLVDEARISARLNHPNVVQTNEVGSVGNQYFIAMEYLDGQPLHRLQHRAMQRAARANAEHITNPPAASTPPGTPSSPPSVVLATDPFPKECQYLVILDTLAGLHHAHELNDYDGTPLDIVHRDVTPQNVFVTYDGQVKVVDFGIAKAAGRASETRQGVVKGKVRYMAPEQAIGQHIDRRADVFSVGIMLWEAATGRRLWKDMDDLNIVQALVGGTMPISPREIDPNVPEEIDRIVQKALAFNRDDRYANAEDFRTELEQFLAAQGVLTSARRRLAASVAELFKDKRTEIKSVIEKQLAQLKARTANDVRPVPMPVDSSSSTSIPMGVPSSSAPTTTASSAGVAVAVLPGAENGPRSVSDATTELYDASKSKRAPSRLPLIATGAALVAALIAVAVGRVTSSGANTKQTGASALAETTSAEIHVRVVATPPTAQVTIDNTPVASGSEVRMPRDKREHVVRVEAAGFDAVNETVRFENDIMLNVVLTKPAPASSAVAAHGGPGTPAVQGAAARWTPPPPPTAAPKASATAAPVAPPTVPATTPATSASGPKIKSPKPVLDDIDWNR
jgi:serine/threonine protein kinase